jgi:hypothetical protein
MSVTGKGKERADTPVSNPLLIDLTLREVKLKLPDKYSRDRFKLDTFLA